VQACRLISAESPVAGTQNALSAFKEEASGVGTQTYNPASVGLERDLPH
jgi:hypothetical protein